MTKKKTLVVGATPNPERYACKATNKLLSHGHPVELFGIKKGEIQGIRIQNDQVHFKDIDTVTLYIGPKHQAAYFDYILSITPKRVIFNPGTENPDFYELLKAKGISYEEACTLVLLSIGEY